MRSLQIELSSCLLVLTEQEIMKCLALKPDIFQRAIGRGKGKLRVEQARKRQAKSNAMGFDRWQLYEILKGNRSVDNTIINLIEGMEEKELREGIIEYLLAKCKHVT